MIAQKWFPVNAEQGQQSRKILGHTISYHHTIIVDHCCKMWISMNRPYAPPMPLWHLRAVACGMTNWHFQQVSPFNSSQCGLELLSLASTCLISEMHSSTTMKLNYAKTNFRFQFNSSMCLYIWYFDIVLIDLEIFNQLSLYMLEITSFAFWSWVYISPLKCRNAMHLLELPAVVFAGS